MVAEVQTASDTTFRVFDWNRLGHDGKPRALHVEQALECINFGPSAAPMELDGSYTGVTRLIKSPYFSMDRINMPSGQSISLTEDATRIWMVFQGQAVIHAEEGNSVAITRGDTVLLPRTLQAVATSIAPFGYLEVRVP